MLKNYVSRTQDIELSDSSQWNFWYGCSLFRRQIAFFDTFFSSTRRFLRQVKQYEIAMEYMKFAGIDILIDISVDYKREIWTEFVDKKNVIV